MKQMKQEPAVQGLQKKTLLSPDVSIYRRPSLLKCLDDLSPKSAAPVKVNSYKSKAFFHEFDFFSSPPPYARCPSQGLMFLIVSMSPQALSVISEVGDLLQLKYSRHRMQAPPTRLFDRGVYEDIDD